MGNELDNRTEKYIEYNKLKKAQQELLNTTPVELTPFYRNKVMKYFNNYTND